MQKWQIMTFNWHLCGFEAPNLGISWVLCLATTHLAPAHGISQRDDPGWTAFRASGADDLEKNLDKTEETAVPNAYLCRFHVSFEGMKLLKVQDFCAQEATHTENDGAQDSFLPPQAAPAAQQSWHWYFHPPSPWTIALLQTQEQQRIPYLSLSSQS